MAENQVDMHPEQVDASAEFLNQLREEVTEVAEELWSVSGLTAGDVLVVGCSSSEILGERIGTDSSTAVAKVVVESLCTVLEPKGVILAAQCCEHLNRALVLPQGRVSEERDLLVNVVPQPKAGGSFATAYYEQLESPVVLEHIRADAGLDIGLTLIGMHLREVAVPVRLHRKQIGNATIVAARTRAKYIGGPRAHYDEKLF